MSKIVSVAVSKRKTMPAEAPTKLPEPFSQQAIPDVVYITEHAAARFKQRLWGRYKYDLWQDDRHISLMKRLFKDSVPVDFRWNMTPFYVNKRAATHGKHRWSKNGDIVFIWHEELVNGSRVATVRTVAVSPFNYDNEVF